MYRFGSNIPNTAIARGWALRRSHATRSHTTFKTSTDKGRFHPLGASGFLPRLEAADLSYAEQLDHVNQVSKHLVQNGVLKIRLAFADDNSQYLKKLLLSLHLQHGHQLPISHSATRGWFWDVRPKTSNFQARTHQARSETMDEFPWHTDCSYEDPPPKYFALQVLQHDRYGGGTLSIMNVGKLCGLLSRASQAALMAPEYRMRIPPEFIKDPNQKHIIGSVLGMDRNVQSPIIRFRADILTPLTERATRALDELKTTLGREEVQAQAIMHLHAEDLPKGSVILVDNRRWLHARNTIRDPERHLRRVRWDACSFDDASTGGK